MKPPIWSKSRTVIRLATERETDYARRISIIAEQLRQTALDQHAGKHPKIVLHFSEPRTEVIICCTVVW